MSTLKAYNLTTDELALAGSAINSYGTGEHPSAEGAALPFFKAKYAKDCLEKAVKDCKGSPMQSVQDKVTRARPLIVKLAAQPK
jgi:hypothetical protein